MINDQLTLDLDNTISLGLDPTYSLGTFTYQGSNSLTVNSPYTITGDSSAITTVSPASYPTNTITIGDQTFGEKQIEVLKNLKDWQKDVDAKLAILRPNPKLEAEWTELKELRDRYVELEIELTEKAKMWDILKD